MTIDLNTKILDYSGKELIMPDKKPLILKDVIMNSINVLEKSANADEKMRSFSLSVLVQAKDVVELSVEDLSFIKNKVGLTYNALVYGRVHEIIEGAGK